MARAIRPHPCPPPDAGWWAGSSDETVGVGPFATEQEAIDEAIGSGNYREGTTEDGKTVAVVHVGKYQRIHVDLSRQVDAARWIDDLLDNLDDELGSDENGENHPIEELTAEDIADLQACIESTVWHWQHRKQKPLRAYWMDLVQGGDYVTVEVPNG